MSLEPSPAHPKSIHKILLYGNSILIAGLISKLAQVQDWDVSQVQDGCVGDLSGVDVIAFDVRDNNIADTLPRLRGLPGIALVGLDALTDTVTVLTGHSHPAHSMQDVLDVLKNAL
ncbi:MAG: hypothetical protein HY869_09670 [Chloroflexi bacterium]|nr:hypothetical protein [Chloroflexota bacterium]